MVAYVFKKLLDEGEKAGVVPALTEEGRLWFRERAKLLNPDTAPKSADEEEKEIKKARRVSQPAVGSMFIFNYNPKGKDTLPYYDRRPVIFPFEMTSNGFLGINVHYLPLELRALLMDGLYSYASNKSFDENTTLLLSYQLLKETSKLKWYKPCVKRYLFSQVQGEFIQVYSYEWDIALFMPLQKFEKASQSEIWKDSRAIIAK